MILGAKREEAMKYILFLIVGAAIFFLFKKRSEKAAPPKEFKPQSYTIRQGKPVPTDKVFDAWTSGDLDKMLKAVNLPL